MTEKIRKTTINEVHLEKLMKNKSLTVDEISKITGIPPTQMLRYRNKYTTKRKNINNITAKIREKIINL